jgi:hypothetical protein
MLSLAGTKEGDLEKRFPSIDLLLREKGSRKEQSRLGKLDSSLLFRELEDLERAMENSLSLGPGQRELYENYHQAELLRRLNQLTLSGDEFASLKEKAGGLQTAKAARLLSSFSGRPLVLSRLWEARIKASTQFYETALSRDQVLERRLETLKNQTGRGTSVREVIAYEVGATRYELLSRDIIDYANE